MHLHSRLDNDRSPEAEHACAATGLRPNDVNQALISGGGVYRCGWAAKPGHERGLSVAITRKSRVDDIAAALNEAEPAQKLALYRLLRPELTCNDTTHTVHAEVDLGTRRWVVRVRG